MFFVQPHNSLFSSVNTIGGMRRHSKLPSSPHQNVSRLSQFGRMQGRCITARRAVMTHQFINGVRPHFTTITCVAEREFTPTSPQWVAEREGAAAHLASNCIVHAPSRRGGLGTCPDIIPTNYDPCVISPSLTVISQ